jgi:sugar/nucleoside kinase (ribokinase family)
LRIARVLANGNYLCAHLLYDTVREYDPQGKTVWEITNADLPAAVKFMCTCGLHRLPNGNTVISNWLGHGGKPPHLIEVAPEPTAVGFIVFSARGTNLIVIDMGANGDFLPADIQTHAEEIRRAEVSLSPLEIPLETALGVRKFRAAALC